jgi:hypothetical protein
MPPNATTVSIASIHRHGLFHARYRTEFSLAPTLALARISIGDVSLPSSRRSIQTRLLPAHPVECKRRGQ